MYKFLFLILFAFQWSAIAAQSTGEKLRKAELYLYSNIDSVMHYVNAIKLNSINKEPENLARFHLLIGKVSMTEKKMEEAIEEYHKAIVICQENQFLKLESEVYDAMSYLYLTRKSHELTVTYASKSLALKIENGYDSTISTTYYYLGNSYFFEKNYLQARQLLLKSSKSCETCSSSTLGNIFYALGNTYYALEKYDSAEYFYDQYSINTPAREKPIYLLPRYLDLYIKTGKLKKAAMLKDSIHLLTSHPQDQFRLSGYGALSRLNEALGNYKEAYDAQINWSKIAEKNFKISRDRAIKEIEEVFLRDKKVLLAKSETQLYRIITIALIVISIMVYIFFQQKLRTRKIKMKAIEKENKLAETTALLEGQEMERKRIAGDLHDGLGVLLTSTKLRLNFFEKKAHSEGFIKEYESVSHQLDEACTEVRKIAHDMMPGILIRLGLIEAVEELMDQIEISYPISIIRSVNVENVLFEEKTEIMIYRILQELFNNSLKHSKASKICLSIVKPGKGLLEIHYQDNGIGFNKDEVYNGLGVSSINSRISYLNAHMELTTSTDKGVNYLIKIPQND